jgi:hypothetical protein
VLLLIARHQILERDSRVRVEDIVEWCLVEHGDAQRRGALHFVNESLIPDWIECFWFDARPICSGKRGRIMSAGDQMSQMLIRACDKVDCYRPQHNPLCTMFN